MKVLFAILAGLILIAFWVTPVLAAESGAFTYDHLLQIVDKLVSFLLEMAGFACVIAVVYFGVRMVMAREDAAAFSAARKGLGWAVVGTLVIFGVYTIIATLERAVESLPG